MCQASAESDRQARFDRFERVLERLFLRLEHDDLDARAAGILKGVAAELTEAATSLDNAAQWLKDSGKGYEASQTKMAAQRARGQAQGLVGS